MRDTQRKSINYRPDHEILRYFREMGFVNGKGKRKKVGGLTTNRFINQAVKHYFYHLARQPNSPISVYDLEMASIRAKAIQIAEEEERIRAEKDKITQALEEVQQRKDNAEKARFIAENP